MPSNERGGVSCFESFSFLILQRAESSKQDREAAQQLGSVGARGSAGGWAAQAGKGSPAATPGAVRGHSPSTVLTGSSSLSSFEMVVRREKVASIKDAWRAELNTFPLLQRLLWSVPAATAAGQLEEWVRAEANMCSLKDTHQEQPIICSCASGWVTTKWHAAWQILQVLAAVMGFAICQHLNLLLQY